MGEFADMCVDQMWDNDSLDNPGWDQDEEGPFPYTPYKSPSVLRCDGCDCTDVEWAKKNDRWYLRSTWTKMPHICNDEIKDLLE